MADVVSWSLQTLPRQRGRTAVVTGANSGIGLETTRGLAALGVRVVMACRSLDKAHAAADDVRKSLPGADLDVRELDLADLASVAAFAETFLEGDRIDRLVNNAGVMALPERKETADGFEMQFGTNVLGHFALTARLLPNVLAAPGSRVVWLSSIAHRDGRLRLTDLQSEDRYDPWAAYRQSKLADLMLSIEMQRRLAARGEDTVSVAAHPGVSATALSDDMMEGKPILSAVFGALSKVAIMPAWRGALPTLVAAAGHDPQPGGYVGPDGFREMRGDPAPAEIAPRALDPVAARQLWDACQTLTGVEMLS
ncbi:oxidoreductase [Rubrivirga sp.]|uniref:oxidoreductase n=1 Tax=Rubrivirga sp. TaxID=1885344 RepID=UPI003B52D156